MGAAIETMGLVAGNYVGPYEVTESGIGPYQEDADAEFVGPYELHTSGEDLFLGPYQVANNHIGPYPIT